MYLTASHFRLDRCWRSKRRRLSCAVDLEGLANHRGSAGGMLHPQPAQRSSGNAVAIEFMKFRERDETHLVMEDEGRLVVESTLAPE